MSQIQQVIERIKASTFKGGLAKLADEAGVPRATARDLLGGEHAAVKKLKLLEAAVDKRDAADPA